MILETRDEGRYKRIRDAVILCCATFPVCFSILILIKIFSFPLWTSPCQGYSRAVRCWWCSHMELTSIPKLGSHRHGHSQTNYIPVYNYASSRSRIVLIKQTTLDNESVLPSKHNLSSNDTLHFPFFDPSLQHEFIWIWWVFNMNPCSGLSY